MRRLSARGDRLAAAAGSPRVTLLALPLLALLLVAFAAPRARASATSGTESPFTLGVGARALAMGRAAAAIADGATALVWNPARLASVQRAELSLFRTKLFVDGANYHAGLVSWPTLDFGTLAVGYQRLDVDGLEKRDDRNRLLGSFDDGESNLLLGYGRAVGRAVALGGAIRLVQQSLDGRSDLGVGLDLGIALERAVDEGGRHTIGAAASVQNVLEPRIRLDQEDVEDPRSLKLGLGYRGSPAASPLSWALAADVDLPRAADARLGLGAELTLVDALSLRGGSDDGHLTLGFGLSYHGVRLAYALRDDDALPRNDRFTVAVSFGEPTSARRLARQHRREQEVASELAALLEKREQQEIDRARHQAEAALAAGDFEDAARLLRRLLALDPDDAAARGSLEEAERQLAVQDAQATLEAGEFARAAAAFQGVLERWPDDEASQHGLQAAREGLAKAADRRRQLDNLFSDALDRFSEGNFDAAEAVLDELLRLDRGHKLGTELRARVQAARRAWGLERLALAREEAENARYDQALTLLREARRHLGATAEVVALEEEWQKARARARTRAEAAAREEARRRKQEVAAPEPTSAAPARRHLSPEERQDLARRYRDGLASFRRGDFERAITLWRTVWIQSPDYEQVGPYLVQAYLLEGVALYSDGSYDEALDRCDRVLEIDPANEKARRYRARILEEKQEVEHLGSVGHGR